MDEKELSDPLNNVSVIKDERTRSNMGSSSDSEKMIQRLNDELREAQEFANTEKHKCMELQGILEDERKVNKQQADESVKQIKLLQGQLRQLRDEMVILREQLDLASSSHDELQRARGEAKELKRALQVATEERDHEVASIQTNLSAASKDIDKWRQTASKYERGIDDLQQDLQQQSKQWQKTAEIQASELQSMQMECNGLQKECSVLQSEKQDIINAHQRERSSLQTECASLRADKEELCKLHQREKGNLQSECAALRSEKEEVLQKQKQLEKDSASSRAQNVELSNSIKALERSQQELEKSKAALQLQNQQDSTKLQTQLDEADSRSETLQKECEEAKTELSDLKEKYEEMAQEKQFLAGELEDCKASMKELQEKGTKKPWIIWGPAVAVALTAVTVAVLFRN
ncbi:sarcolemma associated protein b isoform X2 [Brachionichthys hirsutus]|uniref:sarcolemma associated protein b isoform X2 n=1 Tax=Brachionichthys hirsutus TaxID=412623 RepID=UPI00360446A8